MMNNRFLLTVLPLLTWSQPTFGQKSVTPKHAITSSWHVSRNSNGKEVSRELVNRSFSFAFRYINTRPTDLLFVQEIRTQVKASEEGDNGRIHLEAWANTSPDTGYHHLIWQVDAPGDAARPLADYYEITEPGCCDTRPTRVYRSLATGREVAAFTDGPVAISGYKLGEAPSQRPWSIVYLSSMGTRTVGSGHGDSLAIGEVRFLEGDSTVSQIVLRVRNRNADPANSVTFAVMAGRDSVGEGGIYVRPGAAAAVHIFSDALPAIVIPIRGRALSLIGATLPSGVTAQLMTNH
jgi:hypothetical protein